MEYEKMTQQGVNIQNIQIAHISLYFKKATPLKNGWKTGIDIFSKEDR